MTAAMLLMMPALNITIFYTFNS